MFFFHHPRKVTSNKEVAVQVVQNRDRRTPIDTRAAVIVVQRRAPVPAPEPAENFDFDKGGSPLLR